MRNVAPKPQTFVMHARAPGAPRTVAATVAAFAINFLGVAWPASPAPGTAAPRRLRVNCPRLVPRSRRSRIRAASPAEKRPCHRRSGLRKCA